MKTKKYLSLLNEEQKEAATSREGAYLTLAKAGTGKTQVIAARIANMLDSDSHITPNMILCLTYTDSGAYSMKKRLLEFIGVESYKIHIYTFHGFCNEVIQSNMDYFNIHNIEVVSDLEIYQIMFKIIDSLPIDNILKRLKGNIYYDANRMKNLFHTMKNEDWSPEYIEKMCNQYIDSLPEREDFIYKRANKTKNIKAGDVNKRKIDAEKEKIDKLIEAAKLLPQYNEALKNIERYDYDDLLIWVINAFKVMPNLLLNFQERYQYILLDEMQDISGVQQTLLNLLTGFWDNPNIFAVGDINQTIYEFGGARLQNVIDFQEKHNATVINLYKNYRSNQQILDASQKVIDNSSIKFFDNEDLNRNLVAVNKTKGVSPKVIEYSNIATEENAIIEKIKALKEQKVKYGDIGVLYRKHKQADNIIKHLQVLDIPINIKRKVNILETIIVKNVITMLEFFDLFVSGKPSQHLLFELLHFKFFKLSTTSTHRLFYNINQKKDTELTPEQKETVKILDTISEELNNCTVLQFLEIVYERTGLLDYIINHKEKLQLLLYVNSFFDWVKSEAFKNPQMTISVLLDMIEKMNDNKISIPVLNINYEEEGVNFTTIHAAKGLEWKYVFLIGCSRKDWEKSRSGVNSFSLPDNLTLSVSEDKIESNRRLFYVGVTRAEEYLEISYPATDNDGKELERSQFIDESEIPITKAEAVNIENFMTFNLRMSKVVPSLEKDYLDRLFENYSLSVSHMNKYLKCPLTFYYENVLRVPSIVNEWLIYGNGIHLAMQNLYNSCKSKQTLSEPQFINVFLEYINKNSYQLKKNIIDIKKYLGRASLHNYYQKVFPYANKISLNEYNVKNILIEDVPFKIIMDKLEFDNNNVVVVDYKTGNVANAKKGMKVPDEKNPLGGNYWRQLICAKLVIDNMYYKPWEFKNARLDIIDKEETISILLSDNYLPEHDNIVKKQIKTTYEKIKNYEFSEGCGDEKCKWCNFQKNII